MLAGMPDPLFTYPAILALTAAVCCQRGGSLHLGRTLCAGMLAAAAAMACQALGCLPACPQAVMLGLPPALAVAAGLLLSRCGLRRAVLSAGVAAFVVYYAWIGWQLRALDTAGIIRNLPATALPAGLAALPALLVSAGSRTRFRAAYCGVFLVLYAAEMLRMAHPENALAHLAGLHFTAVQRECLLAAAELLMLLGMMRLVLRCTWARCLAVAALYSLRCMYVIMHLQAAIK